LDLDCYSYSYNYLSKKKALSRDRADKYNAADFSPILRGIFENLIQRVDLAFLKKRITVARQHRTPDRYQPPVSPSNVPHPGGTHPEFISDVNVLNLGLLYDHLSRLTRKNLTPQG
jgi:hypothetical protein